MDLPTPPRHRSAMAPITAFAVIPCLAIAYLAGVAHSNRASAGVGAGPVAYAESPAATGPTSGSTPNSATAAPVLISQSDWVDDGSTFSLTFGLPPGIADQAFINSASVIIDVGQKLSTRSAFDQTLSSGSWGRIGSIGPLPLNRLVQGSSGGRTFAVSFEATSGAPPATQPSVPVIDLGPCPGSGCSGVYPVQLRFAVGSGSPAGGSAHPDGSSGPVLQPLVTDMVFVETTGIPVPLGLVLEVPLSTGDTVGENLNIISALDKYSQVPVDILPVPQVMDALASRRGQAVLDGVAQRVATGGSELVGETYVPVNLSALADDGLPGEVSAQFTEGRSTVDTLIHQSASPSLFVNLDTLDRSGLTALQSEGVRALVLTASDLTPVPSSVTVTHPWQLSGPNGYSPDVATTDAGLAGDLASTPDPVLAAHRVLADLSQVWGDAPNQTSPPRAMVFVLDPSAPVDPTFVTTLLQGLVGNPLVAPMTLSAYFAEPFSQGAGGHLPSRALEPAGKIPGLPAASLRSARTTLQGLESAAGPSIVNGSTPAIPPVSPTMGDPLGTLGKTLLSSEAGGLSTSQRSRLLTSFRNAVEQITARVTLAGSRTVTLTSRSGIIPIDVTSSAPFLTRAQVTVSSDKLDFPLKDAHGCTKVVHGATCPIPLTSSANAVSFPVIARASGDFPLRVVVSTPYGALTLVSTTFSVRSRAFSTVAIVLTSAAAAFLVTWWTRSALRSRAKRLAAESEGAEEDDERSGDDP